MLDFLIISSRNTKQGVEVVPKFRVMVSKDLMIRGGDFYAIWDEERKIWSTDKQDVVRLIDNEINKYLEDNSARIDTSTAIVKYMWDSDSGTMDRFNKYCQKQLWDHFTMLDEELIFSNTELTREKYASKVLPYPLEEGSITAYDKLMNTLYDSDERHKLEWAIGAIVSGDSKTIQKFMVLYGSAGTGKSTVLNIIQELFKGYDTVFDAKTLGSANASFALEPFQCNPLVAIQHDGDLSRIEDNTRLNSLTSHETMSVNVKFRPSFPMQFKAFLFMGTNKPVKITDAKSGLLRRLIDVSPSGRKVPKREYEKLIKQISFELGGIAYHCLQVYLDDPGYYDDYTPRSMMSASNDFYNFMLDSYSVFKKEDGTTLKAAWEMYRTYSDEANMPYPYSKRLFKEELKNYFEEYEESVDLEDGTKLRSYYSGFLDKPFEDDMAGPRKRKKEEPEPIEKISWINFDKIPSLLDTEFANCPAQYATDSGTPTKKWDEVTSTLSELDTSRLHYVKVPDEHHIVVDFDKKDSNGNKSYEKNLEEASKWPPTYAELSKSGAGIHLHYLYSGDVSQLSRVYDDEIEIKIFSGNSSLRRALTKCNDLPIATLNSGLPLKEVKSVINFDGIKSEKALRTLIKRHLAKEIMGATKPSIDMIAKVLDEAYESGLGYDVSDMKNAIIAFAAGSTNQADKCLQIVSGMKWKSEETNNTSNASNSDVLVFYDCEVFPNLFLVNYKFAGEGKPVVRLINPKPYEIEELVKHKLVGFNCRRYDNHMLYGALMGYTNEELYNLSQRIINAPKGEKNNAFFAEAYNISYTDVYDFAAKKQSLKKWEIELGLKHHELGLPWDQPVPEEKWQEVAEYCDDDVYATEAVFESLKGDWTARQILADLAGMSVNTPTNTLTTRIIFGTERNPKLVYTDLATGEQIYANGEKKKSKVLNSFEGYEFVYSKEEKKYKNMYRGTDIGFGGYIRSWPGIYGNVALLDISSLHPNSIRAMQCFGEYTKNFTDLLDARVAIKHGDFETARQMLNGRLAPYLDDESTAKDLAQALKIAINSVYGLTAASFDNPFRDPRNKNNIVALRGALFMRTLQDEVEKRGFKIVAIKTDSIKIADATKEIVDFCMEFAKKYGYTFEFESFYDKICQINDADYIARYKDAETCERIFGEVPGDNKKYGGEWTATGKQFQVPYVFKTLFSKEEIVFEDLCETKEVKTALYLDMNEDLPDVSGYEKELEKTEDKYKKGLLSDTMFESECSKLNKLIDEGHYYHFIGKVSNFCPIKPGHGGGLLVAKRGDKYNAAAGTKGYRWLEANMVRELDKEDDIDKSYYRKLVDDAVNNISQYGDFEWFASDDPYIPKPRLEDFMNIPETDLDEIEFPFT